MKRIALLVLALAANVIADEEKDIQQVAMHFETDVQTVKECLNEANMTVKQMHIAKQKWAEIIKDDEEIDEETKESFMPFGSFTACMLEKKDLMHDGKLVLDNILEALDKDQNNSERISKEVVTECVNSLNENDKMIKIGKEYRAMGFLVCISRSLVESDT
ncbi:uncharacterized protein LOC126851338 [Cataglyphis hispanica]|uniref:uncharacterized protein LOC126851338 n=1 Tax=Cataglyphis hispanica TaxID=1086592 RepID=UPI00217FE636|nr:uncharacterized protein LOC126851338 [Cataglyphis hispanica]